MAKLDITSADYIAERLRSDQQQFNQAMAAWLPQQGILTMAIPTSLSPPEIVTVRSRANDPECLGDLLPHLTPAQREAAITLATRCGTPDYCYIYHDMKVPDLNMEWGSTRVLIHGDARIEGQTLINHSDIDEIEQAVSVGLGR